MILADLASIILMLAIPVAVSYRIFSNDHNRPRLASWALAVIGGPFVYGLLALLIFAISRVNVGGFFEGFLVLLASLVTASVCAIFVRPEPTRGSPVPVRKSI